MSSDNAQSYLIGAHELGHSIGNLADEYQYAGYGAYPYPSSDSVNISVTPDLGATKWYRWLGEQDPTGSVIGDATRAATTTRPASTAPPAPRSCGPWPPRSSTTSAARR
ncbi:hypothetical protein STANM309S_04566 [Streptomyces tanashiensis]